MYILAAFLILKADTLEENINKLDVHTLTYFGLFINFLTANFDVAVDSLVLN
jgi:hypothetical protein